MNVEHLIFRIHAIQRMFQRAISVDDIRDVLNNGTIIENYSDDKPYPSFLMLGWCGQRPIHLVAAKNVPAGETIIITVYEPDLKQWESGFKRRR